MFLLTHGTNRKRTHVDLANIAGYNMDEYGRVYPMNISMPQAFSSTVKDAMAVYPWKQWSNQSMVVPLNSLKKQEASGAKNPLVGKTSITSPTYLNAQKKLEGIAMDGVTNDCIEEDKDFLILDRESIVTESLSSELCSGHSSLSPPEEDEHLEDGSELVSSTLEIILPNSSNPLPVSLDTLQQSTHSTSDATSEILLTMSSQPVSDYISSAHSSSTIGSTAQTESLATTGSVFSNLSSNSSANSSSALLPTGAQSHHNDESAAATTMLTNRNNRSLTVIYNSSPPNFDTIQSSLPNDESKDSKDSPSIHFMKNDRNTRRGCFKYCCKFF